MVNSLDSVTTAVIIAGDFNAHLGPLAGPRGIGNTNSKGIASKQLESSVCGLTQSVFLWSFLYLSFRR